MVSVKNKMSFNKYFCKIPNKKRRKNFLEPPEVEEIFLRGILHKKFSKNGENLSEKNMGFFEIGIFVQFNV